MNRVKRSSGEKVPPKTRLVEVRDVPNGTVVWYDGFWGVKVSGGPNTIHGGIGVDFWDLEPSRLRLDPADLVSVPYGPEASPSGRVATIPRVAGEACPKSGRKAA